MPKLNLPEDSLLSFEKECMEAPEDNLKPPKILQIISGEDQYLDSMAFYYVIKGSQKPKKTCAIVFVSGHAPEKIDGHAWRLGNKGEFELPYKEEWKEGAEITIWMQAEYNEGKKSEWWGSDLYKLVKQDNGIWYPMFFKTREEQLTIQSGG